MTKKSHLPSRDRRDEGDWTPNTKLGQLVKSGKITSLSQALKSDYPLREPQIVDHLMGEDLVDEVLKVNMVQRMTDSGRRTRFSITVVVGNSNGYVGLGSARGKEVGPTIKKAIDNAKLNMVELIRGCGSWECGCMTPHSLPFKVEGKSGSTEVTLRPAPRGVGLAVGDVSKKILKLAGVKDAWGFSRGQTKTTVNNAKAVMDALLQTNLVKVQPGKRLELRHLAGREMVQTPPPVEDIGGEPQ
ncbi:MAG: 30S ribosomal protein S5 [Thermoplasmatota archaeon]